MSSLCPKCGYARTAGPIECPRCGIIYAKFEMAQKRSEGNEAKPLSLAEIDKSKLDRVHKAKRRAFTFKKNSYLEKLGWKDRAKIFALAIFAAHLIVLGFYSLIFKVNGEHFHLTYRILAMMFALFPGVCAFYLAYTNIKRAAQEYRSPPTTLESVAASIVTVFGAIGALLGYPVLSIPRDAAEQSASSVNTFSEYKEIPLSVPSDSKASYFVLEKSCTGAQCTILTKRVGSSGTSYSKRLYDCSANVGRYLATGESLEALKDSPPEPNMSLIVEYSIKYYVGKAACK